MFSRKLLEIGEGQEMEPTPPRLINWDYQVCLMG